MRAYVLEYQGTPVGSLVIAGEVNDFNQYEYTHELTLTSMRNTALIAKRIFRFAPNSPHLLEQASLEKFRSDSSAPYETLYVQRNETGLATHEREISISRLPQDYSLQQYLGLERWLTKAEVVPGDQLSLVTIGLEQQESYVDSWTVVDSSNSFVLVRSQQGIESEYDVTQAFPQLTVSRHPSGLTLRLVDERTYSTLSPVAELSKQPLSVPVTGSLPRPSQMSLLELGVTFTQRDPGPWSELLTPTGTLLIDRQSTLTTKAAPLPLVSERNAPNSTSEEIQELANSLTNAISSDNQKLAAIVKFVHDSVRYGKSDIPQSATTTLRHKSGDCSDIADLVTALAIAAGLQSRTVYGLAYDEASTTFGIHAWNQVRLRDGQLRNVDPTWNQLHVDATHIEFPEAYAHQVLATLEHMEFSVIRFEHFESQI